MLMICKDWYAWINNQPPGPPRFHLTGGVEVGNPGVEVVVTKRSPSGINPSILMLDVSLYQRPGMWTQVMTCAPADYEEVIRKPHAYTAVQIFNGPALIGKIDTIDIVS